MSLNQILVYVGYGFGALFILAAFVMIAGVLSGRNKNKVVKPKKTKGKRSTANDVEPVVTGFGAKPNFFSTPTADSPPVAPQRPAEAVVAPPMAPASVPVAMPVQHPQAPIIAPVAPRLAPSPVTQPPLPQAVPQPVQSDSPVFTRPSFGSQDFSLAPEVPNSEKGEAKKDNPFNFPV